MASSGSKSVSVTTGVTLKFNWSQSSQSVSGNSTTISWNMQVILASGHSIASSASKDWSVTINGKTYSGSNSFGNMTGTKTMASGTATIGHNSDGTKTFSYSFSQEFAITYSGTWIGTKSGSGSGTLNAIARASTVSGGSGTIGSATTITITRASSSFTHTLTYSFGSLSGTIATGVGTSCSWTIPTSFTGQIGSAKSGTGTITCTTYNGSTNIGSKTCSFTASVSNASAPSLTVSIVDTDSTTTALTGDNKKLVRYYSDAKITLSATAKDGATIKSYSISGGGGSSTSSSATFNNITGNSFTCKTTDSRGFTTTVTSKPTMVDYVKLTCVTDDRKPSADGYMTVSCSGKYFNGSFGATSNSLTVKFRYKVSGGSYSGWTTMTNSISGNAYTSTYQLSGLDYMKTYVFQFQATDKLATVTTGESSAKTLPVFDWGENDFNFNVETNWNFGVDITATTSDGHKRVAFTPCSSAGNTTIGYGSYDEKQGYMNIYGNDVQVFSNNQILVTSPTFDGLIVKRKGSTNGASVGFANSNGVLGYIGMSGSANGGLYRYSADTNTQYKILDSNGSQKITGSLHTGSYTNNYHGITFRRYIDELGNYMGKMGCSVIGSTIRSVTLEVGSISDTSTEAYTIDARYSFSKDYFITHADNTANIGSSNYHFKAVYATNGTIQTSDGRYKYILEDINGESCYNLIKDMNLYGYSTLNKRIDEYADVSEISDELQNSSEEDMNIHMGFVAQEIEDNELSKYILIKDGLEDEDGNATGEHIFGIDNYAYTTAVHGALKYEISLRDKQIEELKQEIEELKQSIRGE